MAFLKPALAPLTILLPLKGRHLFTLRWMWHANRIRLPFHVVIADGEVNPIIGKIMDNPSNFPDLSYEYHRYKDHSFNDFYRKCVDAISKVQTPYVMMADNDDFLMPSGIAKSLDFLRRQPDYVCRGGKVGFFSVETVDTSLLRHVVGSLKTIGTEIDPYDINHGSAAKRVQDAITRRTYTYYNVHLTSKLRLVFEETLSLDIGDLVVYEWFITNRDMTLGKAGIADSYFSYLRQTGTSLLFGKDIDSFDRIFSDCLMESFQSLVSSIARLTSEATGESEFEVAKLIRDAYSQAFRSQNASRLKKRSFKDILRWSAPGSLQLMVRRIALLERLKYSGASNQYIESFRKELQQIEETLEGQEFLDFLHFVVGKDLSILS